MAKKNEREIDEDFIIASMNTIAPVIPPSNDDNKRDGITEPEKQVVSIKKEDSRKKKNKEDYESLFIRETPITGRKEKTTYLRSKFYRKIQNILLYYDNPNLSVFGYIDTVLAHHFEMYEQDIKEILKQRVDE
ncbi:DUF3408 domain-containing protein [Dysgonomonas sp. 521]|uniref:DUF3408 domain-containing protein n=1 Tax=Dysgonomonas sp. 521 TaxID=2302932 RepID=UPI0013D2F483|nr:DUF3408 domain-containing protein [Dysgonomonas sp. 521]NDV97317.1 DUF3408 domain-containing protein [Dysgonomonas sp. 521]